LILH